jgi:carbon storage regulator
MLVLTRRTGESLMIGDEIEISIIEVQGDKARIGITAPKEIRILRKELLDEVRSTNAQAAAVEISLDALADAVRGKGQGS